jgi:hypothetical protein
MLTVMKESFRLYWSDGSPSCPCSRNRVAYLLRAARSRRSRNIECVGALKHYRIVDSECFICRDSTWRDADVLPEHLADPDLVLSIIKAAVSKRVRSFKTAVESLTY